MTTYRDCCGTLRGMIAHQAAGEAPCGWCRQAENTARLAAEGITWRPTPASTVIPHAATEDRLEPVTAAQAAVNAAVLAAELETFEDSGPSNVVHYRRRGAA